MPELLLGDNEYCQDLAIYLRDRINTRYQEERVKNPKLPNIIVVKGIRNFDDIGVPISEFPLLKVYRSRDTFRPGTFLTNTNATITYSVSYPDLRTLPDLMYWVGKQLNYLLQEYNQTTKHLLPPAVNQQNYAANYLLTANELTNTIYPFLRFDVGFQDLYQNS